MIMGARWLVVEEHAFRAVRISSVLLDSYAMMDNASLTPVEMLLVERKIAVIKVHVMGPVRSAQKVESV